MAITKRFIERLDIKSSAVKHIGNMTQYDTGNEIVLRLVDENEIVDLARVDVVVVSYLKPSNTVVIDSIGDRISISDVHNGEITVHPHSNALNTPGLVVATVSVYSGRDLITSAKLSYECVASLVDLSDTEVENDSNYPVLLETLTQVSEAIEKEKERIISENLRKETEIARAEAEAGRVQAENARVLAEQRREENVSRTIRQAEQTVTGLESDIAEAITQAQEDVSRTIQSAEETVEVLESDVRTAISGIVSPTVEVKRQSPTEYILTVNHKEGSFDTPNLKGADGEGSGDMRMSAYDTNADGKVNEADYATEAGAAVNDGEGNNIVQTYQKRSETAAVKVDNATNADYATAAGAATNDNLGNSITQTYQKRSETAGVKVRNAENADYADHAGVAGVAESANQAMASLCDGYGNEITETYATIRELANVATSGSKSDVGLGNVDNVQQMPIAGGTFTGNVAAYSANRSGANLRNAEVVNSAWGAVSTNKLIFVRK